MPGIVAERRHCAACCWPPASRRSPCRVPPGCYVMQAAAGQADVLARSEPIEQRRRRPGDGAGCEVRARARRQQAREFAVRELGAARWPQLPQLRRPRPPVRGVERGGDARVLGRAAALVLPGGGLRRVSRLFRRGAGRRQARRLAGRGDDVEVGGVATYSTLGHLPDPVFNTMLGWRETRFVGTIFHELAHERLYVAGDSEFNEAFASVVEQEGMRRWLQARGHDARARALPRVAARARRSSPRCCAPRASGCARLYASGASPDTLRGREAARVRAPQVRVHAAAGALGGYAGYDALVRAHAQQRAPRRRGDLPRLRAGAAARTRGGWIAARVLRPCRGAGGGAAGCPPRGVPDGGRDGNRDIRLFSAEK